MTLSKTMLYAAAACALATGATSVYAAAPEFKAKVGFRGEIDTAYYNDKANPTQLQSGTSSRRMRLNVSGDYGNWFFKFENDFSEDDRIRDAYLGYKKLFGEDKVTIGQFRAKMGLDSRSSSSWGPFMERSMPEEIFAFNRAAGIGYNLVFLDDFAFIGSAQTVDVDTNGATKGNEPVSYFGVLAYSPVHTQDQAWHFGINAARINPDDNDKATFKTRPEIRVNDAPAFVTTTLTDVRYHTVVGAETAFVYGPFSAQAEYMQSDIKSRIGSAAEPKFKGYYVLASYFLTGEESRNYKLDTAGFAKPNGIEDGAWEVAARYSHVDLTDKDFGGEESNTSLALTYYPNEYIKFTLNVIHADVKKGIAGDEKFDVIGGRMMFVF